MFCSRCGAPNEDGSVYCGNCGAALEADALPVEEAAGPAEPDVPAVPSVEEGTAPVAAAVELDRKIGLQVEEPAVEAPAPAYLLPAPPPRRFDPNTAFLVEFLAGFFGLLGIGYLYTGRTNDGVVRLVAWLLYNIVVWVVIAVLIAGVIGCFCAPIKLAIQVGVPLMSANTLKKRLLAEA
jgi:TM2 domain-containing membrane protein YozV